MGGRFDSVSVQNAPTPDDRTSADAIDQERFGSDECFVLC